MNLAIFDRVLFYVVSLCVFFITIFVVSICANKKRIEKRVAKKEEAEKALINIAAKIEELKADKEAMAVDLNNANSVAEKRMITREIEAIDAEINKLSEKK